MRCAHGCLVALALLVGAAPAWAVSGLMVHCDIPDAQVSLDGRALGTCTPGRFTVEAGSHKLLVRKDIDAETEWFYGGEVDLPDNEATEVKVVLTKHLTAAGMEREMAARAASLARAERLSGEFVTVKGGCFQMGDLFGDGGADEKPVHEVCVKGFKLAKYEVTQWQWREVMGTNPSRFKDCGLDCPVEKVSFDDIQAFIGKLNAQAGGHYRLPTEAEWEYACRGGGNQQRYCGGDDLDALAWYAGNSGGKTHAVGGKQANGLGLYDMSGNVWEWTCSQYFKKYAGNEKDCSSNNDVTAGGRGWRGGSWYFHARLSRVSYRHGFAPDARIERLGLRLAQDL